MNDHFDWQAAQHADECLRQQRIDELIRTAGMRPLTPGEQQEIAIEAGIGELHNPKS